MSDEVILYYNPMSRAQIAHLMLEEVGAPYRLELVSFAKAEHKTAAFLALNPMGKLPTIVHRGVTVTEAPAICAYLADAFPQAKLAPPVDDPRRGTYYRWLFFAASCVEYASLDKALGRAPGVASRIGYGSYDDTLKAIERAIQPGPWILGEQFTAADVYLGAQLQWGMMTKSIEARPAFTAYTAQLARRPGFQRYQQQTQAMMEQVKSAHGA